MSAPRVAFLPRMTRKVFVLLGPSVILVLFPHLVSAQGVSDEAHRAERCRFAAQIVETGHPAPHEEWAFGYIGYCGATGGAALAKLLRASASTPDSALLDRVLSDAHLLQDGDLFEAELSIFAMSSNSAVVRMLMARSLGHLLSPATQPTLAAYGAGGETDLPRSCTAVASMVFPHDPVAGTPLPVDFKQQIRSTALMIRADSTQPRDVRAAAYCLEYATRPGH